MDKDYFPITWPFQRTITSMGPSWIRGKALGDARGGNDLLNDAVGVSDLDLLNGAYAAHNGTSMVVLCGLYGVIQWDTPGSGA